ncbi:hypothetical protein [Aeromonas allosaccharophila]|uniref:hypothetical protein n=1 Tax=Aeromonas allosaccharophila TaxID=656 RepID=UPI00111840D7|nr:hypothetical protein [Aeromonas allosaccharophila]
MTQEVISDFLIAFGFDGKTVRQGINVMLKDLDKLEKKVKGFSIKPDIKPRISAEKRLSNFTKKQLQSQFALKLSADQRYDLARRLTASKTMQDARQEMAFFMSNHRKKIQAIKAQAGQARRAAFAGSTGRARAVVGGAIGVAGGVIGGGYGINAIKEQESKVKDIGKQFESLVYGAVNALGSEQANRALTDGAKLSKQYGTELIATSKSLIDFISLMKVFGDNIDESVKNFERQQNAMNFYGVEDQANFLIQANQAFSQNTLDSFQESFRNYAPKMLADLELWLKNKKGITDFQQGITSSKYKIKDIVFEFYKANAQRFEQGAKLVSSGSAANEQRVMNQLSLSFFKVFNSSGFQSALVHANDLLIKFAGFLEVNANKIGKLFDAVNQGLLTAADKTLNFMSKLNEQDIDLFTKQLVSGVSMFADIMTRLYTFLDAWLPKSAKPATQEEITAAKQRYQSRLESTNNWRNAPTYAPAMMMQQQQNKSKTMAQVNSSNVILNLTVENAQGLDESKLADKLMQRAEHAQWQAFRNFTAG